MLKTIRKLRLLILLLLFLGLTALLYLEVQTQSNTPLPTITLAVAKQPAFSLIYVADKLGFFEEEGIKIDFNKYILGRDALKDVVEGEADLATVYDIPTLNQINKGTDLAILTTLHSSEMNHVVASFKSSGIVEPGDLRGKRVAMTRGTSTEFFLYSLLITEGIDLNEIWPVSIEPDRLIDSLESHDVDAAVLFNPYTYIFQRQHPSEELIIFYSDAYKEMSILTGKRDYVEANKDKIIKVLRALYKAEKFIENNREESIRLVDEWLDNYDYDGVVGTWDVFKYELSLNNKLLIMMEREARFYSSTGFYQQETPYLRQFIVTEYLDLIKPEGVTIY